MSEVKKPKILSELTSIDSIVFSDFWTWPDDSNMRVELVREAVEYHLEKCAIYRAFAERRRFSLAALRGAEDLASIPQMPVSVFKHTTSLLSCSPDLIDKWCTSSGTMGKLSRVPRDQTTIERFLGSVRWGIDLIGKWEVGDVAVLNLGPNQHEAGDLWFAYVSSLIEVIHPTVHAVENGYFDARKTGHALDELESHFPVVLVLGPPPLVVELAREVAGHRSKPTASTFVITAGGWKRRTGEMMNRAQFNELVCASFNLVSGCQVRDAFNQVELNTVLVECENHRKHVPPWLEIIVRDPQTLEPVDGGVLGLLSYLDPTASSYPCFFIGDDFGRLEVSVCPCGRTGRTLAVERRIKSDEEWGCAQKMDGDYNEGG